MTMRVSDRICQGMYLHVGTSAEKQPGNFCRASVFGAQYLPSIGFRGRPSRAGEDLVQRLERLRGQRQLQTV